MESPGYGVGALLKLAARVEDRQGDFGCRFVLGGMESRGNAAAVIRDRDTAVDFQGNLDRFPKPCHVFIDAVVHHLVHEMVQAVRARAADVHRGPFPNGFETFKHTDLLRTIAALLNGVFGKTGGIKTCGRWWFVWQTLRGHLLVKHGISVYMIPTL